jgi:aspartate aminotransferase
VCLRYHRRPLRAALSGPQGCVTEMLETYRKHRTIAIDTLDCLRIPYLKPQGAFYLWANVGCFDSNDFAERLLREKRVAVAPGTTFGPSGAGYIRVSLASGSEDIREGLLRLSDFLEQ